MKLSLTRPCTRKRIRFRSNGIADEILAVGIYVLQQTKRKKLKVFHRLVHLQSLIERVQSCFLHLFLLSQVFLARSPFLSLRS